LPGIANQIEPVERVRPRLSDLGEGDRSGEALAPDVRVPNEDVQRFHGGLADLDALVPAALRYPVMAGHVVGLFRTPPELQEAGYDLPLFEGIAVVKSRDQERYRLGPAVRTAAHSRNAAQ
jgi:hypothetical protein